MRPTASATLLVAFALACFAGCGSSVPPTPPVPDSALPIVVLDAYLAALRDGDCPRSRTLETASFAASGSDTCTWFQTIAYEINPHMATPTDGYVEFDAQVTTRGGTFTVPDGPHTLFFSLLRQASGAWRVSGGGTGP